MAVDGDGRGPSRGGERGHGLADIAGDLFGERAAVGVAEHDSRGAGPRCGHDRLGRIRGVEFPAIEEVLGVVEDLAAGALQERHRIGDHRHIFLAAHAEHLGHMEGRRLADDRDHGRAGGEQGLHAGILRGGHAAAAGHPKGADLRSLQPQAAGLLEVLGVFGVRERVAALDVVHARVVEPPGDGELVLEREVHAFALRAVAERGVVDFDRAHGAPGGGRPASAAENQ